MFGQLMPVAIVGIFFLESSGIRQKNLEQLRRAARTVNGAMKSLLD